MSEAPSAEGIIRELGLEPHPEGGWFRETFRDEATQQGRSVGTAIYYLLEAGQRSHWHRVDAAEVWHYYAGAPLLLRIADDDGHISQASLGADIIGGERPQAVIPAGRWQSAESRGAWTLVGCTVAPGFEFDGFELAPDAWVPGS
jgi:predicted cupin superfamily sugar epimerase